MTFPVLSANGPSGYKLTRSLRFRSSASAYLNRTPATATNRTTWTWSGWVKRGTVGVAQIIFQANGLSGTTDNDRFLFYFNATGQLSVDGALSVFRLTNAVFRDPSAWYHIVLTVDTGNATTNNRILLYVNGVSQSFSTNYALSSSQILAVNGIYPHYFSYFNGLLYFVDGYLAEVNFIDGQALTPSSFGSTNSTTGVWQPAAYTGTYGTNGFYLPFTDNSALTTASNAGLGKDFSGNANYWVTNNISITAGSTYDSMTDVPTLTSATAANFAVLNPLQTGVTATYSNGNLTAAQTDPRGVLATIGVTTGKWYWEITNDNGAGNLMVGVANITIGKGTASTYYVTSAGYCYFSSNGNKWNNNTGTSYGASYTTGDVIGVALDLDTGTLVFYKNGTSQGTAFTGLNNGNTYTALIETSVATSVQATANFGQRPFSYTPPSGFVALNTYNLPASTIQNGASYMAATLYTGSGSSQTVANTVGSASFQPDLVWIKCRSSSLSHKLTDSVRGVTKALVSNTTAAETTDTQGVTAFGSTGFTIGTDTSYNNSPSTYIAWSWKAGGTAVSNTDGSITSSVSANTTSGFSVVTYTGTGSAATVGHGLGVAPQFIILKSRSNVTNWNCYHVSLGNTQRIDLNLGDGATTDTGAWSSTTPTSTVFSIANAGNTNISGATYVAYCFAAIKGFSSFGSYAGNTSTDGPFVYCGFRPRWVLIKKYAGGTSSNWFLHDTSRDTYNSSNTALFPNTADLDSVNAAFALDILSNGFKLRTTDGSNNVSGYSYLYAAFAENPFQNALAR